MNTDFFFFFNWIRLNGDIVKIYPNFSPIREKKEKFESSGAAVKGIFHLQLYLTQPVLGTQPAQERAKVALVWAPLCKGTSPQQRPEEVIFI